MRTVGSMLPTFDRMRSLAVVVGTLTVLAGCQVSATASPTPATATPPATSAPPSGTATASAAGARWEAAGTMSIARYSPHALLLGDGRVLVVGNDAPYSPVRDDTATAELWDPVSGRWTTTAGLNKPRVEFAAAPMKNGSVMVTGGLDQGTSGCDGGGQQSFSSTYLYDPQSGAWTRGALLQMARSAPSVAVLPDGRVLVAGGYYYTGASTTRALPTDAGLAAYRPASGGPPGGIRPGANDVVPPTIGAALATAELYDPATGTWSATGSMVYARFGAPAVTLSDGRVLVVGSGPGVDRGVARVDDKANVTAEIYDPRTGRFALAGSLPGIDWAALSPLNLKDPGGAPAPEDPGTLVALADGGALLVGDAGYWKHQGEVARSFRFDAKALAWTETGQPYVALTDEVTGAVVQTPAIGRLDAMAARLPDGRVLVAGGDSGELTATVQVYDPAANAWSALPPMPGPRAAGAIVTLHDGSLLIVGGTGGTPQEADPCTSPLGLDSAIRYVPGP